MASLFTERDGSDCAAICVRQQGRASRVLLAAARHRARRRACECGAARVRWGGPRGRTEQEHEAEVGFGLLRRALELAEVGDAPQRRHLSDKRHDRCEHIHHAAIAGHPPPTALATGSVAGEALLERQAREPSSAVHGAPRTSAGERRGRWGGRGHVCEHGCVRGAALRAIGADCPTA